MAWPLYPPHNIPHVHVYTHNNIRFLNITDDIATLMNLKSIWVRKKSLKRISITILKQNNRCGRQTRSVALGMQAMSQCRVMEVSYNLTKCRHKRNKLAACKSYLNLTLSQI